MADLRLIDLSKRFEDGTRTLDRVSLDVADREFVVIVGPSGCGNSTGLRVIAGSGEETSGEIWIGGQPVNHLSPGGRDAASGVLREAVGGRTGGARGRRDAGTGRPSEPAPATLSGGQRQRVAMGSAMVRRLKLFLFDEPLSNLDARLRVSVRAEILPLQAHVPTTTVHVTHDQTEAMTMADRVVVMNGGRIEQTGAPMAICRNPASLFVARFIGSPLMNVLDAELAENGARLPGGAHIPLPACRFAWQAGRRVALGFRPEAVTLADGETGLEARVRTLEPLGQKLIVEFSAEAAGSLWSRLPPPPDCAMIDSSQLAVFKSAWVLSTMSAHFWARGGRLFDDAGRPVFAERENREKMLSALNFYENLVDSGAAPARVTSIVNYDEFNAAAAAGTPAPARRRSRGGAPWPWLAPALLLLGAFYLIPILDVARLASAMRRCCGRHPSTVSAASPRCCRTLPSAEFSGRRRSSPPQA